MAWLFGRLIPALQLVSTSYRICHSLFLSCSEGIIFSHYIKHLRMVWERGLLLLEVLVETSSTAQKQRNDVNRLNSLFFSVYCRGIYFLFRFGFVPWDLLRSAPFR